MNVSINKIIDNASIKINDSNIKIKYKGEVKYKEEFENERKLKAINKSLELIEKAREIKKQGREFSLKLDENIVKDDKIDSNEIEDKKNIMQGLNNKIYHIFQ